MTTPVPSAVEDLRVVMFSNLYPPVISGSSTHSSSLARELTRHGCQVSMITARLTEDSPAYEWIDGVHVHRLPAWRLPKLPIALNFPWLNATFSPGNVRRIEAILDERQPHVLHLHNHMFDLGFSAVLMSRRRQLPLVCTIHTMIRHANPLWNLLLYPADRLFLRHAVIRNVDVLISPDINISQYAAHAFQRRDSVLIPYGVALNDTSTPMEIERERTEHDLAGKRVILSLGHVHEIRNRRDLVAAMPAILKAVPNALLLIVGAVSTNIPVQLAQELGVADAVRFTGPIPHRRVPALLALAEMEAHWLNQDAPEHTSLGIASLEAMGAGKTVLAAASPDSYGKGMLRSGENCVLVAPDQPQPLARTIIGLLQDPMRRARIGSQARQVVRQHFSWNAVCQATIRAYRSVCRETNIPRIAA